MEDKVKRRVVITGMGAVTPVGNDVNELWASVCKGKSGISEITQFDVSNCDVKLAAEVKNFNPEKYIKNIEQKKMDRFSQMAVVASCEAYLEAGLQNAEFNHERFSVVFGCSMGGGTIGPEYVKILKQGYNAVSKMTIPINMANMASANIAIKLKAHGSCTPVITACSTGTDCIGKAFREIRDGYSDIVATGAAEAPINPTVMAGFASIGALTTNQNIRRASIPFDGERSGFVMGEGAGALILEEYYHAKERNAKILGEVVAYGSTCDAYSLTSPDFTLKMGSRAIREAIREAEISETNIDYINAHGTSTKLNDRYETEVIKNVFGEYSKKIAISSTKSMLGHSLGASGAIETIICAKAIETEYVPPTINYCVPDEKCDLNYTPNIGIEKKIRYALNNSLGFGGHNAVLILKKCEEEGYGY